MSIKSGSKMHIDTLCVHAGVEPDATTGAIMTPIYQTSTFVQAAPGQHQGYDYSRGGNPTRTALETAFAAIENAAYSISFASGLAAIQAIIQTLDPGAHVLVCDDVYGGTGRLFRRLFAKYDIEFEFIEMTDPKMVANRMRPNTKMVWVETPTNPLLKIIDIKSIAASAKQNKAITVVDNTFASPVFQQPLALGADVVVHSSTKYLGGHSDLIGGVVMLNDNPLAEQIRFIQFAGGAVNSPFECFMLLRSLKTLALRMHRHHENAIVISKGLKECGAFSDVIFPGLEDHPQHALAKQQMSGFAGMISVRLKKGTLPRVTTFLQNLKLFALAESLGGVESLVNHPETMTHASVPEDHRKKIGITSDLIRFSVGIEEPNDLMQDIVKAAKSI